MSMGEKKSEGAWDRAKGKVKKAWGEITEDPQKKREGAVDRAKGTIKEAEGEIEEKTDPDKT